HARQAVVVRAADLDAVHPGDVGVVDRAETEANTARCVVGRELERDTIPRDAVEAIVALLLPQRRHGDGLPPALVERGVRPEAATVDEPRVGLGEVADLRP